MLRNTSNREELTEGRGKAGNKELLNLYHSSHSNVLEWLHNNRGIRLSEHMPIAWTGEMGNAYKILLREASGKEGFVVSRVRGMRIIYYTSKKMWRWRLDSTGSGHGPGLSSCENGNGLAFYKKQDIAWLP